MTARLSQTQIAVLVCGSLILVMGIGIRASYGLFLTPMTTDLGWTRENFAFALALQQLVWGALVPVWGAIADRYGTYRVLVGAAAFYAVGQLFMAFGQDLFTFNLGAGVLVGTGIAGLSFGPVLAAMARAFSPEKRSLVLGFGTAAGSMGQFLLLPLGAWFLDMFGWALALAWLAAFLVLTPVLAIPLRGKPAALPGQDQSLGAALREALGHRGFIFLACGYFVCGFQVAFMTVHLPAYLVDVGLPLTTGAFALMVIGLFNIVGSFAAGWAGQNLRKKYVLAGIYLSRAIAVTAFLLAPPTVAGTLVFAAVIGVLWLSTVPLTTGLVGQIFGVRYLATLSGVVFFSHQVGSFLGVWLGGYLYDATGSYDIVWWGGVILALAAAAINLPVNDRPMARLAKAAV